MEIYDELVKIAKRLTETTEHRSSVAMEIHPDGSGVLLHLTLGENDEIGTALRILQWSSKEECLVAIADFDHDVFFHQIIA